MFLIICIPVLLQCSYSLEISWIWIMTASILLQKNLSVFFLKYQNVIMKSISLSEGFI